ncbi:MAG: deoxyguanosinetriphosphate triphosphohydrolase [Firmicutes bacterium]|nr:deoxyguanosinetriphosphate triphosphohydrolase [Bacillota bacterium]
MYPYGTPAAHSRGRRWPELADDPRTAFQRDRDRILHSAAFRRLQYKTQVFVFHEGDFYRTRLTHSLEVAQIGAALARMVGANPDLVEAISLAHDLGHPPFGHGGEEELNRLMEPAGGFDHNLQALRIVDELELRYPSHPGLNLTWEVREGIARHETFFDRPPVPDEFAGFPQPGLEAQLSSLADMIAYCTHDLEDALAIGFVREEELERQVELWQELPPVDDIHPYPPLARQAMTRSFRVRSLIDRLVRAAAQETLRRLSQLGIREPDDVRRHPDPAAGFPPEVEAGLAALKDFLTERVYSDPRTVRMMYKGRMILNRLFEAFYGRPELLPRVAQERLWAGESRFRVVCDYISSMTDRHAMDLYDTLFHPYERSLQGPA